MKTNTTIKIENSAYTIKTIIGNIALLESIDNKSCLYNIKTHEMISEFDDYYVNCYTEEKFFFIKLPNSRKDEKYYDVYDAEQEKYLLNNLLLVNDNLSFSIFKNPLNNKYYIFDMKLVRNGINTLQEEYDDCKFLISSYIGDYAVVTKDDKKGVYQKGKGLVVPLIYDDIRMLNKNICILEHDGQKQFAFHSCSEGFIVSRGFKDIWIDKKYPRILYGKDDSNIYIYDLDSYKNHLMCIFPLVDEISCSYINKKRFIFTVGENSKYGLYGFNDNYNRINDKNYISEDVKYYFNSLERVPSEYYTSLCLKIVPIKYDGIDADDNIFTLYTDLSGNNVGKKNFYCYNSYSGTDYYKEENVDDFLVKKNILLLFNGNNCDIYTFNRFNEAYIRKCKYIDHIDDNIIYEKYGRKGIFMYDEKSPYIYSNLDDIKYKVTFSGHYVYVITKHNKQGVLFGKSELIKPDNIIVEQIFNPDRYSEKKLYFVLLCNGKKLLKYLGKKDYYANLELNSVDGEFSRIEFYKDFYLVDNEEEVILYDYDNNKITTFVNGTIIEQLELDRGKGKIIVYKIEDKYYFYLDGIFEEALEESVNRYFTTFEINGNVYEISTLDKDDNDSFCDMFESLTDEKAEKMFTKYLNDSYTLKNRFPSIKLIKKNNDK